MSAGAAIAVVGSCNMDLVVPVAVLPRPGETVLGRDHLRVPGGKGANQAVAVARLGRGAAFVGRVGDDDFGRALRSALDADGVTTEYLITTPGVPSGVALITVDAAGENTIAVSPGANARLTVDDVHAAGVVLTSASVTLLQLEVPVEAVAAAVAAARGTVVLNPAPARILPAPMLERVDLLVPNRGELAVLTGVDTPPTTTADVADLARTLGGPAAVVVTLGVDGALVVIGTEVVHVTAHAVDAVDATGAGDAFCAGLADALAGGASVLAASRWAVRVAGLATTRWGALPGMPTRAEVVADDLPTTGFS